MEGTELKTLREKHNLTQEQLAKAIGTNRFRVSKWENGVRISKIYVKILTEYFAEKKS